MVGSPFRSTVVPRRRRRECRRLSSAPQSRDRAGGSALAPKGRHEYPARRPPPPFCTRRSPTAGQASGPCDLLGVGGGEDLGDERVRIRRDRRDERLALPESAPRTASGDSCDGYAGSRAAASRGMPADGRAAQPRNPDDCQRAYVASAQRVSRLESVDRKLLRVSATLPSMRDHGDPLCTARVHVHLLEHSAPANGACDITMPLNCGAGTGGSGSADGSCRRRSAVIAPAGRHSRRRVGTNTRLADHRRVLYPRFSESLAASWVARHGRAAAAPSLRPRSGRGGARRLTRPLAPAISSGVGGGGEDLGDERVRIQRDRRDELIAGIRAVLGSGRHNGRIRRSRTPRP